MDHNRDVPHSHRPPLEQKREVYLTAKDKRGPLERMTAATDDCRAKTHEITETVQEKAKEVVDKTASMLGIKGRLGSKDESSDIVS